MGIEFLLSLLAAIPGTVVYHLLILLGLLPAAGIVLTEWQHTRSADLKPYLTALVGTIGVRVLAAIVAPFHLQSNSTLVIISAPFLYAGEWLSILLLVWAFGQHIWHRHKAALALALFLGWGLCWLVMTVSWYGVAVDQPLTYNVHSWQVPIWYGLSAVTAFGGVFVLRRAAHSNANYAILGALVLLGIGAVFGLLGSALLGPVLVYGEGIGRLCALVAYPLFAISLYRSTLQDLAAHRQDLQELSKESLRQSQELLFLIETTRSIGEELDLGGKLSHVAGNIAMALRADAVAILLADEEEADVLHLVALHQVLGGGTRVPQRLGLHNYPELRAVLQEDHQALGLGEEEVRIRTLYDLLGVKEKGPLLIQPVARQGRVLGVILVYNGPAKPEFTSEQELLATTIGVQIAGAVESNRLYGAVGSQARELTELLKTRENEFKRQDAILESMSEGIVASDARGRIVLLNRAAETLLGVKRVAALNQPVAGVLAASTLKGRLEPDLFIDLAEPATETFDLGDRQLRANAAPVISRNGERLGVVAVLQDTTRQYLAEESKHDFVASISRELRTPLAAIKGYTEVMLSGMAGDLPATSEQFLNVIRENTLKMASLTDNIIFMADLERDQIKLQYEEVNVAGIVRKMVGQYRKRIEERSLTVDLDIPSDLPPAEADPARLHLILDNLLSNAVKFTFPNGHITIGCRAVYGTLGQPTYVSIWISDTGVGIPPDEQNNVWRRFYRVDNPLSLEAGGLGLGLTIVKTLVEAHGGRVWADSTLNRGSTFTVLLPIKRISSITGRVTLEALL